ncbi:MAG: hypothetical protein AB1921_07575 [Thermodesulfobacteriota bacterium]
MNREAEPTETTRKPWKKLLAAAAFLACLLVLLCEVTDNNADPDLFVYLLYGRQAVSAHALPTADCFSYLPTKTPWVFHEWAASILFYEIFHHLGPEALQVLKYLLWALMLELLWFANRTRGVPLRFFLPFLLASFYLIALAAAPVRIQIFSFVYLPLEILLWESARKTGKKLFLALLPPLFLIWANTHASFAFGLLVCLCYTADSALSSRQGKTDPASSGPGAYALTLAACALVTLANPYGVSLLTNIVAHALDPEHQVSEWQSIWLAISQGSVWQAAAFFGLAFSAALLSPFALRKDRPGLAITAGTAVMGFLHLRHISLFALCAAVYLPLWLQELSRSHARLRNPLLIAALVALVFPLYCTAYSSIASLRKTISDGSVLALITPSTQGLRPRRILYPLPAISFLAARGFTGNLCVSYDYAAFALWYLYPQCRTALDGRCENIFPKEVRKDFFDFISGFPNWREFLYRYPTDAILIRTGSLTSDRMEADPGWARVYEDALYTIFLRRNAKFAGLLRNRKNPEEGLPTAGWVRKNLPRPDSLGGPSLESPIQMGE